MTGVEALDIARDGIWVLIKVSAPLMFVGLFVGLIIALIQALTQVQEMTLVFVPKIIAIFLALLVMLPFMGQSLDGLMLRLSEKIIAGS
ncbi:MAG: flagellar biosynthetic protein FliQ [Fimbriimonadaceae bacterium]|nr:flagellar biosynthetic protein FliQ [Alphaproteobacteria bacterium]